MRTGAAVILCLVAITVGGCGSSSPAPRSGAVIEHCLRVHDVSFSALPLTIVATPMGPRPRTFITLKGPELGTLVTFRDGADAREAMTEPVGSVRYRSGDTVIDFTLQPVVAARRQVLTCAFGAGVTPSVRTTPLSASVGSPNTVPVRANGTAAGARVIGQTGCLACHEIDGNGNHGPGPVLSDIGDRLTTPQLHHALIDPVAPMPSYRSLPAREMRALIAYLAALKQG